MRKGDVIHEKARIGGMQAENDWTVTEWENLQRVVLSMPGTRLGDLRITYEFTQIPGGVEFYANLHMMRVDSQQKFKRGSNGKWTGTLKLRQRTSGSW
jgi:hypothetical protein